MHKRILLDRIVISGPCTSGPCLGQVGFDPCESTDDITERDLEALLKEEAARSLQKSKQPERPSKTVGPQFAEVSRPLKKSPGKQEDKGWKKSDKRSEKIGLERKASRRSLKKMSSQPDKTSRPSEKTASRRSEGSKELEELSAVEEQRKGKAQMREQICKVRKNPFFTNRLKFRGSCATRPPIPPPQNLPLVDDVDPSGRIICPPIRRVSASKTKRRKKTEKHAQESNILDMAVRRISFKTRERWKSTSYEPPGKASNGRSDQMEKRRKIDVETEEGPEGRESEAEKVEGPGTKGREKRENEAEETVKGTKGRGSKEEKVKGAQTKGREKESLKKPCRKRTSSEKSIFWLPGQIPFPQKELPPTSPRDISQRQILLPTKSQKCKKKEKQKK